MQAGTERNKERKVAREFSMAGTEENINRNSDMTDKGISIQGLSQRKGQMRKVSM